MIVEFYGLPGGGKSTLVRELASQYPGLVTRADVESRRERLRLLVSFFWRHCRESLLWLSLYCRNGRAGLWRYKATLLTLSMARTEKAVQNRGKGIVLVDEGLFQRLLSLLERALPRSSLRSIISRISKPDVLVVVTGGNFRRFLSWEGKEQSPRFRRGERYLEEWRKIMEDNYSFIEELAREAVPVITIDPLLYGDSASAARTLYQLIISQRTPPGLGKTEN